MSTINRSEVSSAGEKKQPNATEGSEQATLEAQQNRTSAAVAANQRVSPSGMPLFRR